MDFRLVDGGFSIDCRGAPTGGPPKFSALQQCVTSSTRSSTPSPSTSSASSCRYTITLRRVFRHSSCSCRFHPPPFLRCSLFSRDLSRPFRLHGRCILTFSSHTDHSHHPHLSNSDSSTIFVYVPSDPTKRYIHPIKSKSASPVWPIASISKSSGVFT